MASPHPDESSFLIIGAGVFGTSTALSLIQKYKNVTLVDRTPYPSQVGASWDWNKVVRADYANALYMKIALEAMELWRSDPLFKPFYHESGLVWLNNNGFSQAVVENYKQLSPSEKCRLIKPDAAKNLWDGLHADANYDGVDELLLNENSGWADASAALTKSIGHIIDAGVKYVVADVDAVVFDEQGATTGVRTTNGDILSASHVILATGAMTAKLLADSAPERKEMQIDGRLVAAAVCTGMTILSNEETEEFRKGPVFVHDMETTWGGYIPPNAQNQLKFYRDVSFTNTTRHEASQQDFSIPPGKNDYAQWDVSPRMKHEISLVSQGIFGAKSKGWKFENFRICWDAITPNQDPIICKHPHSDHLYIATGGSFHSWKFLPVIGKYVLQMLEGTLDDKLVKTWAWDRDNKGSAHESLLPKRELRDI